MITFVYGAPGSGKTEYIFRTVDTKKTAFILVPEQETVFAERLSLEKLGAAAGLNLEVLNFTRLCNRVFRQYGGLASKYITLPCRSLFMWKTLRELSPMLEEYGPAAMETSTIPVMLAASDELRASGVSTEKLEKSAEKLPDGELKSKMRDISLITASFNNLVSQSFDDKTEELSKLSEILKKQRFFAGCDVYIDSFTSFTALEYSIIERIIEQADNVTVTLSCSSPEERLVCTESVCETAQKLIKTAEGFGKKYEKIFLTENFRAKNAEMRELSENIWKNEGSSSEIPEDKRGNIKIFACPEQYAEADTVAAVILSEVASGLRYRDIAVIARDISAYDGIIDAALETAKIPFFMSRKADVSASPAVAWLLSALRIGVFGWRRDDVTAYIRTGLCDVSPRDADMFEEYVFTWGISGKGFTDGEFDMNPDGFTETLSERGTAILNAANAVREAIVPPLENLFTDLEEAADAKEMCGCLFDFMKKSNLAEKLREAAEKELSFGQKRSAGDILSAWNIIIELLDDVVKALGEDKLSIEELYKALSLAVKSADLGSIPTGYDEVTLGSASLLRSGNIKCAIIMGLNEGEFPAAVSDHGVFTETDRKELSTVCEINLSTDALSKASDELLFLRRAVSLPSDKLYLLYTVSSADGSKKRPSLLIDKITSHFGYIKPQNSEDLPLEYRLTVPEDALRLAEEKRGTPLGASLSFDLASRGLKVERKFVSEPECTLDKQTIDNLFARELKLSQSKINDFKTCPFKYYSKSVLGLRNDEKAEIQLNILGTVVHAVLEEFLKRASSPFGISEEYADKIADEIIEKQLSRICTQKQRNSNRVKYIFGKIKNIARIFVKSVREDLAGSSFKPEFFELHANEKPLDPLKMRLDDGRSLVISEIIDRVDVYREGGKVYVRVVDYKTGKKKFDPEKVKEGLDIQLLLYLMSVCRSEKFAKAIGCESGDLPEPAAMGYVSFDKTLTEVSAVPEENGEKPAASQNIKKSGLFIDEENVASALGTGKDGKDMKPYSKDQLDALEEELNAFLKSLSGSILGGKADAEPLEDEKPCNFCKMAPFCRSAVKSYIF